MKRTLIIDPPGPFSPREEIEEFLQELKELPDAHLEPANYTIKMLEEYLEMKSAS